MHKLTTLTWALGFGVVWAVAPALAGDTKDAADRVETKAERAADKVEDKSESTMDKLKDKARNAKEKVSEKVHDAKEKLSETAHDAKEKVSEKTQAAKEKVSDKLHRNKERAGVSAAATDVKAAQQALRDHGHDPGPIDGVMGPRTTAALRSYQRAEGLTPSGALDDATAAKLNIEKGPPAASPATEPKPQTR